MSSKAAPGQYAPTIDLPEHSLNWLYQLMPAAAAVFGSFLLVMARFQGSKLDILREASLTNLAVIAYIAAGLLFGMYLIGREPLMRKMAMWAMGLGFMVNFAAWGARWIEYTEFTKAQGDMMKIWPTLSLAKKINHTFPLSNLYDITLGLTTWLGFTSVLVGTRKKYDFLGAVTMPVAVLFLLLAIFLGNDISHPIQPILRSYWRPIHVGVAALSYGVCSVTFAVGVLYLLKDNMKPERVALAIAMFAIAIYMLVGGLFGNFSLLSGSFGMNIIMGSGANEGPVRFTAARGDFMTAEFPYIGHLLQLTVALFIGCAALYLKDAFMGEDAKLRAIATKIFAVAVVTQTLAVGMLFYQMKTIHDLSPYVPSAQITKLNALMAGDDEQGAPRKTLTEAEVRDNLSHRSNEMKVSFNSNPVVSASFFVIIAGGLFFALFKLRGDKIVGNLPSLDVLDDLNYKLVSVCFPGFTLMLILGAVWANESWGTYWSWDPKETWGLVTWLAYAGFLHTRFTHGWKGRRSAYFAIIGFLFMLFTYLGVSYLLPGLHSYA